MKAIIFRHIVPWLRCCLEEPCVKHDPIFTSAPRKKRRIYSTFPCLERFIDTGSDMCYIDYQDIQLFLPWQTSNFPKKRHNKCNRFPAPDINRLLYALLQCKNKWLNCKMSPVRHRLLGALSTVFRGQMWSWILGHCRTFRMELSCLVFLVSYPSRRHRRVVLPDPANSDRFRSAKPSCTQTQGIDHFRQFKDLKVRFHWVESVSPDAESALAVYLQDLSTLEEFLHSSGCSETERTFNPWEIR